jgi:hypothetical protein
MADHSLREPNQIGADCARKFQPIDTAVMFTAILAALLDWDWTTPKSSHQSAAFNVAPTNKGR